MFNELNPKFESKFNETTDGKEFTSLENIYAENGREPVEVRGFFVNKKAKYGEQAIAILVDALVSLPKHLLSKVKAIIDDDAMVEAINEGKAGISVYEYYSETYDKTCYGVNFVDM